jgi:hypothetical protein
MTLCKQDLPLYECPFEFPSNIFEFYNSFIARLDGKLREILLYITPFNPRRRF